MNKLCIYFSLIAAFLSFDLAAADTVRLKDPTNLVVEAVTNTTFTINSESPSGDATSETAPAKVYLPIASAALDQERYFSLYPTVSSLFDIEDTNHVVSFPLYLNVSVTDKYLYAAVKDPSDGDYKVVRLYSLTPLNNVTNAELIFSLSPKFICDVLPSECTSLAPTSSAEVEKTLTLYFFLSTSSGLSIGGAIDPAGSESGGVYFSVGMSNRIYTAGELSASIAKIRQGDRRLIIEYTSSTSILSPKSVRVYDHQGGTPAGNLPIGDASYSGALLALEFPYVQNGELVVTGLVNSVDYNLSVTFLDKYLFATTLSTYQVGTPLEIQELLKKQGCFLLSAGFGEEHFIIDYFRNFRDQVLSKSYFGRLFIQGYYEYAPSWATELYQSNMLRQIVRSTAYFAYYIFNNLLLVITLICLVIGLFSMTKLRKNKDWSKQF